MLPIALMRLRTSPKRPLLLSPYEMMYGRPFLTSDLFLDEDANTLLKHIIDLGRFPQELQRYGEQTTGRLEKSPGKARGSSISKDLARKRESKPAVREMDRAISGCSSDFNCCKSEGSICLGPQF